jgi:hypothetical protein
VSSPNVCGMREESAGSGMMRQVKVSVGKGTSDVGNKRAVPLESTWINV